ncbi:hypothetical protein IE53DRAFT_322792, partial [Violaceomyces palustris]
VVLHPDKHKEPERKAAAESRFRDVQRAYEILTDRERRAVYDYFGEEGLKSSWTVSLRGRTPSEMQAEFERESRRRQAADAESLVKSRGDFTATIDATALFASSDKLAKRRRAMGVATFSDRLGLVGCTQLVGRHGFETQVTNSTAVNFSGQMVSRNGLGNGNLVGTVKTHWSPRLFTELTATLLRPQIITGKGQYTLDQNTFFTWQSTLQTLSVPPSFNVTYGQRLSTTSTLTGFTSVKSGTYSIGPWGRVVSPATLLRREPATVSVGITKQVGDGKGWTCQTSISIMDQSISLDWGTKVLGGIKVRTGFNLGTASGFGAFTNAERRLTENVRLGLGLTCGRGVSLRVKVNRLGQKIVLPILISPDFAPDLILLFTLIPAVSMTALHHLVLKPRKRKRVSDKLANLRKENMEMIRERRRAALEAREVLRDQAIKRASQEISKRGLVIIEAYYGKKEDFPPPRQGSTSELLNVWEVERQEAHFVNETCWDVKIPLQSLVTSSQLVVPGGRSKSNILGFHDPVIGERKHLLIRYLFRGLPHEALLEDSAPLAAPLRGELRWTIRFNSVPNLTPPPSSFLPLTDHQL